MLGIFPFLFHVHIHNTKILKSFFNMGVSTNIYLFARLTFIMVVFLLSGMLRDVSDV